MSVKVTKRQYDNVFREPGQLNIPDWLIGNTGDVITARFELEAGIDFVASQGEPITINYSEHTMTLNNGRKWGDYGFDMGRTVKLAYVKTTTPATGGTPTVEGFLIDVAIENMYNDTLVFAENAEIDAIGFEMIPTDRGTVKISDVKMYDEREVEGIRVAYTHINNDDVTSHNLNSFIDGTRTEAIFAGLDSVNDTSFRDMELIGLQSGMSMISAKIKKVPSEENTDVVYNIPNSGEIYLTLPGGWTSVGRSLDMNLIGTPVAPYQNQDPLVLIGSVGTGRFFINNSAISKVLNLHVRVGTIIWNNYGGGSDRVLRLILHRYTDGTDYIHAGGVELARYNVVNETRGIQYTFDDTVSLNLVAGESYSLAYAWEISSGFGSPSVLFQNNFGTVEVMEVTESDNYKRKYEVELKCLLSSFFEDVQQMENRTPPEVLFNANSLTDVIDVAFYPEWNNPNLVIKNDMSKTERLGNTGWFNENYNGLTNHYQVKELRYESASGSQVDTISFTNDTKVKAKIGGVPNIVAGQTKIAFGFMWVPKDSNDYSSKQTGFHKNTKINSPSQSFAVGSSTSTVFDGYSADNAKMMSKNIIVSEISGDLMIEFTLSPNTDFSQLFEGKEGDRMFVIWVSVGDHTLELNFSDRVNLLLDVGQMEANIPIQGSLADVTNRFLEHPQAFDEPGVEYYAGFVEDDILTRTNFQIKTTDKLNSVTFGFEVENLSNGDVYTLEKVSKNTSAFPVVNGRQEIELNESRGFLLPYNNNKNWITIIRDPSADSSEKTGFVSFFGSKIRWEDWIFRQDVPGEFYDQTKANNGFNNDWLDYLRTGTNHRINFFMYFDVENSRGTFRFKNSYGLTFADYDENEAIDVEHKYLDPDTNAVLSAGTDPETGDPLGVILSNKKTKLQLIYTKTDGDFDISNVYCVTRMELFGGAGEMKIHQISSIWEHNQGGLLIPLENETRLKVEQIDTNKIRATCLIDPDQIQEFGKYKITGRIGCYLNDNGTPIETRIYQNEYESNYE